MAGNKADFECPDCGGLAPVAGGNSTETTTGRRRRRRCNDCDRLMLTFQPRRGEEQFVRWMREASAREQAHYARIRGALSAAGLPWPFFEALARAGRRLAVPDLQAVAMPLLVGEPGEWVQVEMDDMRKECVDWRLQL